jgi:putative membrane protein
VKLAREGDGCARVCRRAQAPRGSDMMPTESLVKQLISSVVFSFLGLALFGLSFMIIKAVLPFSLRKEIEEDQNTALGIMIGSVIIGLSMIIAAAIKG